MAVKFGMLVPQIDGKEGDRGKGGKGHNGIK